MNLKLVLVVQAAVMAVCMFAVAELATHFPFPSPLVRPLLTPRQAYPTEQVMQWVESGKFDGGFLTFFARDPDRSVPKGANLVAPADGNVQGVHFDENITYLIVGLSFWDVHVVRTPVAGVVTNIEEAGTYYPRDALRGPDMYLKGKAYPVQQIVTLDTAHGEVKVRLITSYWASRLKVWVKIGDRVGKGDKIGRILLGSTVIAELPGNFPLHIKAGERVVGGETIISGAKDEG